MPRRSTAQGGDYLLALKGNHALLHADVQRLFADEVALAGQGPSLVETVEKETTGAWKRAAARLCPPRRSLAGWAGVQSVACVESRREELASGAASVERRYFLSSLPAAAERLLALARGHWAIENNLHWMHDVHFEEDRCRVRKDHGPLNLVTLRRVALSLAKRDASSKQSVCRLKCAGWDDAYLFGLINIRTYALKTQIALAQQFVDLASTADISRKSLICSGMENYGA